MKSVIVLFAILLLSAAPVAAGAADLVLSSLDVSIGIRTGEPYRDRRPEVVYVYADDHQRGRGHNRRWRHPGRRQATQVIVIDRDRPSHCDYPGNVVVIADRHR